MTDEELRDQGFTSQSISQFRTLETKLQNTNGYNLPNKKPHPPEVEPHNEISVCIVHFLYTSLCKSKKIMISTSGATIEG